MRESINYSFFMATVFYLYDYLHSVRTIFHKLYTFLFPNDWKIFVSYIIFLHPSFYFGAHKLVVNFAVINSSAKIIIYKYLRYEF